MSLLTALITILLIDIAYAEKSVWSGVDKIVAVGDVHGDFEQFVKTLRTANVIDDDNKWIGGKTHLVQTGDVVDRGPDSRMVMDLLMDLAGQALKAGGRVQALIGNHEAMIISNDLRYVHPGEYASYGGKASYLKALRPEGKYGKWIMSHNTVIKINDVLFLHGGISPHYSSMSIMEINETIRQELKKPATPKKSISMNPKGPLWYRGLALDDEEDIEELLKTLFETYGIRRIVVGHTGSKGGIRLRANGKVIMIDVGISNYYGGPAECLVIEKGKYFALNPKLRKELIINKQTLKAIE